MMNVTPFNFKNHDIRVIQDDGGEPWFIAMDVANILDYSDTNKMTSKLDGDETQNRQISGFGNRGITLINESGLYSVILRSDKPNAKPFKKWVTSEVLPSIRKIGSYSMSRPLTALELAREQVALLEKLEETKLQLNSAIATKAEIGHRREATAMNTASQATKKANKLEIELDQSKQYCTIKRMKMLKHGQDFEWRILRSTSNEMEIPSIDVFDSNYGTVKAYHADVWLEAYAIDLRECA